MALQICCFKLFVGNEHEKLFLLLNFSFDCFWASSLCFGSFLTVLDGPSLHFYGWEVTVFGRKVFFTSLSSKFWHFFYLERVINHRLTFLSFYDAWQSIITSFSASASSNGLLLLPFLDLWYYLDVVGITFFALFHLPAKKFCHTNAIWMNAALTQQTRCLQTMLRYTTFTILSLTWFLKYLSNVIVLHFYAFQLSS